MIDAVIRGVVDHDAAHIDALYGLKGVVDVLGEAGFDPVYGARPLKRAIQQYLENPLAQMILKGDYLPGDVINITADNAELVFVPADRVEMAG